MNNYYVYCHRKQSDNSIFYIGKGTKSRLKTKAGRNQWWLNVAEKYGWYAEKIFDNLSEADAFKLEVDLITNLRIFGCVLVNLTNGGDGTSGFKMSEESRQRLSESKLGTVVSEEVKEKIRKAKTGIEQRLEVSFCISAAKIGSKLSPETRQKISQSKAELIRKVIPSRQKDLQIYTFYSNKGELFTGTRGEFAEYSGLDVRLVSRLFGSCARKTVRGWTLSDSTIPLKPIKRAFERV